MGVAGRKSGKTRGKGSLMRSRNAVTKQFAGALIAAVLGPVAGGGAAVAQAVPMTLELDGTRVTLGETGELVVRTTESKALASAAFAFEVRDRDGVPAVAFATLDEFELLGGGAGATID